MKLAYIFSLFFVCLTTTVQMAAANPVAEPLRKVKSQVDVIKIWREKQKDGTFAFKSARVCRKESSLPLYVDKDLPPDWALIAHCNIDLKIGKVQFGISSYGSINHQVPDFWDANQKKKDQKSFTFVATVSAANDYFQQIGSSTIHFEDLDQKSAMVSFISNGLSKDGPDDQRLEEALQISGIPGFLWEAERSELKIA